MAVHTTGGSEITFSDFMASSGSLPPIILLYGNDQARIDAATSAVLTKVRVTIDGNAAVDRIDATEVTKDPSRLFDLFSSAGLFGDAQCLIIENAAEKHAKLLKSFFAEAAPSGSNSRLIIASHDFKRKSSVVNDARNHSQTLVISAYETAVGRRSLAQMAESHGMPPLEEETLHRLEDYSAEHGPVLLAKLLEKLALAVGPGSALLLSDLEACLPETMTGSDELAKELFSGSPHALLAALDASRARGDADARFISLLSRICLDVKRTQKGHASSRARPLFWKTEKIVRSAEQRLDRFAQRTEMALSELFRAETNMRSGDPMTEITAERLCLRLARCFAPSRKR